MPRPLPGHMALKDFNARKAVASNELLRRAYLYLMRNETLDPKIRSAAMLKLNAFPRNVSTRAGPFARAGQLTLSLRSPRRPGQPPSRTAASRRAAEAVSSASLACAGCVPSCVLVQTRGSEQTLGAPAAPLQARRGAGQHPWRVARVVVREGEEAEMRG